MTIRNLLTGRVGYNLSKEFLTNSSFRYYCQLTSSYSFHFYNGKVYFKNVNKCLNTSIYSYLKTSGDQSSNLYLNVIHFFPH